MPITVYARHERTRDVELLKYHDFCGVHTADLDRERFKDVCVYRDRDCTQPFGRFPWGRSDRPDRRFRYVTLNCYRWRLEWLD